MRDSGRIAVTLMFVTVALTMSTAGALAGGSGPPRTPRARPGSKGSASVTAARRAQLPGSTTAAKQVKQIKQAEQAKPKQGKPSPVLLKRVQTSQRKLNQPGNASPADDPFAQVGGMDYAIRDVIEMFVVPVQQQELLDHLAPPGGPPKAILLNGPPGVGKTLLAKAAVRAVDGAAFALNLSEATVDSLSEVFTKASAAAAQGKPAIIVLDEIDAVGKRNGLDNRSGLVTQLNQLMDGITDRGNVYVIATTNLPNAVDESLRRPGRFDREVDIRVPDEAGRLDILRKQTVKMPLDPDVDLPALAKRTHGFTGSDLAGLNREAAFAAIRREHPELIATKAPKLTPASIRQLKVKAADYEEATEKVRPAALRESYVEIPKVRFDEIGGLDDAKRTLNEEIVQFIKNPATAARLGLKPGRGIVLTGPPGNGKTLLAKALATEAGANFIAVNPATILEQWVGKSEQNLQKLFDRAKQLAPTVLFLDEADSLLGKRGVKLGDPVHDRMVNMVLSALDGAEEMKGVYVVLATNRVDLLDEALLRDGRVGTTVNVSKPDLAGRAKIFEIKTRGMKLGPGIDLAKLASDTEGMSGADISGVCRRAGLLALRENAPAITMTHLRDAIKLQSPASATGNAGAPGVMQLK